MADMPDLNCEDIFNQKEENEASMNEEVPIETVATGSEEPEIAAPEMAAPTAKNEKPEIEADPPRNTDVKDLEKALMDGESSKKPDLDQQASGEEKENESKVNSLPKRLFQGLENDSAPPPAKRAKRREPEDKESEPQTKVPDDLANDVDRPQT
nr:uncharacterized protein LOC108006553 [Drosophila suzukii]XP_036676685.1 uncharacterized protein LOC108006553 [Drosophila suzukii]